MMKKCIQFLAIIFVFATPSLAMDDNKSESTTHIIIRTQTHDEEGTHQCLSRFKQLDDKEKFAAVGSVFGYMASGTFLGVLLGCPITESVLYTLGGGIGCVALTYFFHKCDCVSQTNGGET